MRLYVPLICLLVLSQYCDTVAADSNNEQSTLDAILNNIWQTLVALKDAAEPHVRHGAGRLRAFVQGEKGSEGARATNVTIINRTGKSFLLTKKHCNVGQFSERMPPPEIIEPTARIMYGTHSNSFMRGNQCEVKYASKDGDWFTLETKNPFLKSNTMTADSAHGLSLTQSLGKGHANEVSLAVSPAF